MADALAALHASSDRLRQLVGGLDPTELRGSAYPTEWTVADVLSSGSCTDAWIPTTRPR